jgi:predicted transcriptional regulator YheO
MATDWEKEAQRAKELKENETFKKILTYIRNRQIQTFLMSDSDESVQKARTIVQALNEVEAEIDYIINTAKMKQK